MIKYIKTSNDFESQLRPVERSYYSIILSNEVLSFPPPSTRSCPTQITPQGIVYFNQLKRTGYFAQGKKKQNVQKSGKTSQSIREIFSVPDLCPGYPAL